MFLIRFIFVVGLASQCVLALACAKSQRCRRQVAVPPLPSQPKAVVETVQTQDTVVALNGKEIPVTSSSQTQIAPLPAATVESPAVLHAKAGSIGSTVVVAVPATRPGAVVETVETDDTVVNPAGVQVPLSKSSTSQVTPVAISSVPGGKEVVTPLVSTANAQVPAVRAGIVPVSRGTQVFDTFLEQDTVVGLDGQEVPVNTNIQSRSSPIFLSQGVSKREFPDRIPFPLPKANMTQNKPRMFKAGKGFVPVSMKKHLIRTPVAALSRNDLNKMTIVIPNGVEVGLAEVKSATITPSTTQKVSTVPSTITTKPKTSVIKQQTLLVGDTFLPPLPKNIQQATSNATTASIATTFPTTQIVSAVSTTEQPVVRNITTNDISQFPMSRESKEIYAIAARAELSNATFISSTVPSVLAGNVTSNTTIVTTITSKKETAQTSQGATPMVTTIKKTQTIQTFDPKDARLDDEMPPVTKKQLDIAAAKALMEPKNIQIADNKTLTHFADFNPRERFE